MQTILNMGADVDSRFIVVACAAGSFAPQRLSNDRQGIRSWLRSVPRGSRLGIESTGSYHELLADLAHAAGLQVFVLNPRILRRYAQSVGQRHDRSHRRRDDRPLRRPQHAELHAYVPPTKEQRALARLINRRGTLVAAAAR